VVHGALHLYRHDKKRYRPIYVGSVCCFAPLTTSSRFVNYISGPALLATQSPKTHTHTHTHTHTLPHLSLLTPPAVPQLQLCFILLPHAPLKP
jgi:hypothetical protein